MGPGGGQDVSNPRAHQSAVPIGVLQHPESHQFSDSGSEGQRRFVRYDSVDLPAAADPVCDESAVLERRGPNFRGPFSLRRAKAYTGVTGRENEASMPLLRSWPYGAGCERAGTSGAQNRIGELQSGQADLDTAPN